MRVFFSVAAAQKSTVAARVEEPGSSSTPNAGEPGSSSTPNAGFDVPEGSRRRSSSRGRDRRRSGPSFGRDRNASGRDRNPSGPAEVPPEEPMEVFHDEGDGGEVGVAGDQHWCASLNRPHQGVPADRYPQLVREGSIEDDLRKLGVTSDLIGAVTPAIAAEIDMWHQAGCRDFESRFIRVSVFLQYYLQVSLNMSSFLYFSEFKFQKK